MSAFKIAWIGKKTPFCGNVTYCRELVAGLSERGHDLRFFHFADDPDNAADVTIPYLFKSQIYTLPTWQSARVTAAALADWQPDLVHASLPVSAMDFDLPAICQRLHLPLVITFHNAFDRRPGLFAGTSYLSYQLYAQNMARANAVIIFSQLQKQLLTHVGVSPEQIAVIPNAVDTERFCPGPSVFREAHRDTLNFCYMGRMAPEKGLDDLLKTFHRLALPESLLVMVGDGVQKPLLQSLYGDDPRILWTGFLDEAERLDVLRGCDVFVLPSQVEGLSISLLEAMACGLACIATDVGADGEVLAEGAGVVLDPRKLKQALPFSLQLLHQHPDFTAILKKNARQRVLDHYQLESNLNAVEQLYQRLIHERRALSDHQSKTLVS